MFSLSPEGLRPNRPSRTVTAMSFRLPLAPKGAKRPTQGSALVGRNPLFSFVLCALCVSAFRHSSFTPSTLNFEL